MPSIRWTRPYVISYRVTGRSFVQLTVELRASGDAENSSKRDKQGTTGRDRVRSPVVGQEWVGRTYVDTRGYSWILDGNGVHIDASDDEEVEDGATVRLEVGAAQCRQIRKERSMQSGPAALH